MTIRELNTGVGGPEFMQNWGVINTNFRDTMGVSVYDTDGDEIIDEDHGGTGQDSSGWTGAVIVVGGTWSALTQLTLVRGGTGLDLSGVAKGSVLVANAVGALSVLTASVDYDVPTLQADGTIAWDGPTDNVVLNDVGGIVINEDLESVYPE